MRNTRWYDNLIHWITILLVAGMLPLSCIVHCHTNAPVDTPTIGFYVCHPFTSVDTDTPQHVNAHHVMIRATHEFAIQLAFMLISMVLLSPISLQHHTYARWYALSTTPPPR
jgi:hypothetical protein